MTYCTKRNEIGNSEAQKAIHGREAREGGLPPNLKRAETNPFAPGEIEEKELDAGSSPARQEWREAQEAIYGREARDVRSPREDGSRVKARDDSPGRGSA